MFGLGPWELAIVLLIVVIFFGVGKLPELGSGLGKGILNFKKAFREGQAIDVTKEAEPPAESEETKTEIEK